MTPPPANVLRELTAGVARFTELTPAISLAYLQDESLVVAGWGADPDTLFQAASISKPVSAALALCLVADGMLGLDDDIASSLRSWSLPPLETADGEQHPPITLRHLLWHGAGLGVHGFPGYQRGAPLPRLVDILDGRPPANTEPVRRERPPGTDAVYSGGGYTVLQQLVEDASGQRFADLAAERLFAPLRMESATFEQPVPAGLEPRIAPAHTAGRPIDGGWHVYPELAASGLWCTPTDLVRFARGVQNAYEGERGAFLPQRLTEEMLTPHVPGRGLGPSLFGTTRDPHWGHTGGNAGYRCELFASAHRGPAAAAMANSDEGGEAVPAVLNLLAPRLGWTARHREALR